MIVNEKQAREAADLLAFPSLGAVVDADHVKEHYRTAAKGCHPDAGGSAEAFAAVDRAKHILLAWLEKPQPAPTVHKKKACDYCGGLGHVYTSGRNIGSQGLRRTCPKCRGSGDADIDLHNP